jgi:preprotein translocase subunit SecY
LNFVGSVKKFFSYPDLRKRAIVLILLIIFIRVLGHIPLPGVNLEILKEFLNKNQIFGLLNMFSGGTMENFSIILMGVGPYITSSIIIQLLGMIIPSLENLKKEGEYGQKKLSSYTRLLTIPLAIIQGYAMIVLLSKGGAGAGINLGGALTGFSLITALIVICAGTMFLMWLGEIISEIGFGNGISLIITIGILAGFPEMIRNTGAILFSTGSVDLTKLISVILFVVIFIVVIIFIVAVTEASRKIPVSYARQVRGMNNFGRVDTNIPFRVNQGGVIPIIFALAIMIFPTTLANIFQSSHIAILSSSSHWVLANLSQGSLLYGIIYFILVFAFNYVYTAIVLYQELGPARILKNILAQCLLG